MSSRVRGVNALCDTRAAADLFRTLAHPMRLTILCRLLDGELSVSGFENELALKQPNLSQQLAILREANLVTTRREAKSVFYSLADGRMRALVDALRNAISITQQPNPRDTDLQTEVRAGLLPGTAKGGEPSLPATRISDAVECGVFAVVG
nr:metalloregulator ArsR/SmtB family transcription factor [uncultured Rhodopila sp.]